MMDAHTYVSFAESDRIVRCTAIASVTFLVYDHLITLPDEVRYIWGTPFSFPKLAVLANRYFPFITTGFVFYIDLFATSFCKRFLLIEGILFCTLFVVAEGILLMRIYAMWGRNRIILFLLLSLFIPSLTIAYYETIQFVSFASSAVIFTEPRGCIFTFSNRVAYASLTALLLFETSVITIVIHDAEICKDFRIRKVKSALIETLYKDGAFFYVSVLILTAINLVLLKTASPSLCYFFLIAQGAMHSILSNRLVFRIRGVADDDMSQPMRSYDERPMNLSALSLTDPMSTVCFSSIASDIVLSP
ncbi:hypothetical protein ACEPAH_6718 [Sanghuangporus vaninii]